MCGYYVPGIFWLLLSCSVMSDSLWPHGLQHTRLPCSSLSPMSLKLMSIKLVMPSNYLILCHPLLLLCSNFLSWGGVLYTLNLYSAVCQLYPYKTRREKVHWWLLWQAHEGSNGKWPERAWGDFGGLVIFCLLHWILVTQECTLQKLEAAHLKIGALFCRRVTHW